MTLPEVLREVMRLLGDIGCDHVDIARSGDHAYQYRFSPDRELDRGYRLEGRRWMDGSEETPSRGTSRGYVGWSRWSTSFGFSPEGALAGDWQLLDGSTPGRRSESAKPTTTVDLVIRLQVKGSLADVAGYRGALECLADVMAVQAEDGLWSLGQPEAETDDGPSVHVADIVSSSVQAVLIELPKEDL